MVEKEKITQYMEEKLKIDSILNDKTINNDYRLDFPTPQFLDIKKEYYTKEEKVKLNKIKLKAYIIP